jgi:hypothetical protein
VPTVHQIVDAKSNDITIYLQCIDRSRSDINLHHTIYDNTIEFINKSYLYGVVSTLNYDNQFYSQMPPSIKQNLVFTLLKTYYKKFFYFFNDIEDQNFANKVFIRKILSSLDCQIFPEGSTIVEYGAKFEDFYFCYKGNVTVIDSKFVLCLTELPEESFFGDFQILLGTKSQYHYVASSNLNKHSKEQGEDSSTWCMTLTSSRFCRICDKFPAFRSHLTSRGIKRRAHLRLIESKLRHRLAIKDTHSKIKDSEIYFGSPTIK